LEFATPTGKPKTPIAVILGMGEITDFKFGQNILRDHPNKRPLKFPRKGSVGVYRDCPIFLIPQIYQGPVKLRQIHSKSPSEQKPIKNFGKNGTWGRQGLPQFLGTPQLSQEWVKLRTSNFVRIFIASIGRKNH